MTNVARRMTTRLGSGALRPERPSRSLLQRTVIAMLRTYLRVYHRFEYGWPDTVPPRGPCIVMTSHFSILDTLVLLVVDPYEPWTRMVVKRSMMAIPVVGALLRAWDAIPVERNRRDVQAVRRIRELLRHGIGVCIAAEGTRSRTGRLGPMNAALVKIALRAAADGVPILPIVEIGTYEALPPGARFPRPAKVTCWVGDPLDVSSFASHHPTDADVLAVAQLLQRSLSALLPAERRPAPGTPAISQDG